jgi:hypothetical protein
VRAVTSSHVTPSVHGRGSLATTTNARAQRSYGVPRRLFSVALLTAAVALSLTACQPAVRASVLHIGDSIMVQTADDVINTAAFRDFGYLDTFNAMGGIGACPEQQATTPEDGYYWPERIASIRTKLAPEMVVIQLGTNDRPHSACVADYGARAVDPLMEALPGVPVLWLDVREDLGAEATAINQQLHGATARWPNLEVLPYSAHFANQSEWVVGSHLTNKGQGEYARWLIAILDERVPEPSMTTPDNQFHCRKHDSEQQLGVVDLVNEAA